jgi:hypothetical protein
MILISEFMKGSFISGLKDEGIKYMVNTKGAQLVETALQEGSEVKSQKFKENKGI